MIFSYFKKPALDELHYSRSNLLTDMSAQLYRHIQFALPRRIIVPNLAVHYLLKLEHPEQKSHVRSFKKIQNLCVDFAVFSHTHELICVIHLRDEVESEERYLLRKTLEQAEVKQFFWKKSAPPNEAQVFKQLAPRSENSTRSGAPSIIDVISPDVDWSNKRKQTRILATPIRPHNNPNALSLDRLNAICNDSSLQKEYPHIWQRICLMLSTPKELSVYLDSLFVQDRVLPRKGLPQHIAEVIRKIQLENRQFSKASTVASA